MAGVQAWKLLIAAANNPNINFRLLEHTWYGLWDRTLRFFESVGFCFVFPQKDLWIVILDGGDKDYEYHSSSDPEDLMDIDEYFQETSSGLAPITPPPTRDSFSSPSAPSRVSNPRIQGQNTHFNSPITPSPVPLLHRLRSYRKRSASPSFRKNDNLKGSFGVAGENIKGSPASTNSSQRRIFRRKIPDFAILYLPCEGNLDENTLVEEISITHKVVPILVEVKRSQFVTTAIDSVEGLQLELAVQQLLVQIEFLFSSDDYQSAVVAIAASGRLWCWGLQKRAQLNLTDVQWSRIYQIGTPDSNEMFGRIKVWVQEFVINPSSTTLGDIVDIEAAMDVDA